MRSHLNLLSRGYRNISQTNSSEANYANTGQNLQLERNSILCGPIKRRLSTIQDDEPSPKKPKTGDYSTAKGDTKKEQEVDVAKRITDAILEGAGRLLKERLPSWRDRVDTLKPKGTFRTVKQLGEACAEYACTGQLDRINGHLINTTACPARTASLVGCFVEIARAYLHKRSNDRYKITDYKKGREDRRRCTRLGGLMLELTRRIYKDHGEKAYNLCALLDGKCPLCRHSLSFTRTNSLQRRKVAHSIRIVENGEISISGRSGAYQTRLLRT